MKGSIITYKSSSNEEIKLKVEGYGLSENNFVSGEYFGTDYYNDGIGIDLKFLNSSGDCARIGLGIAKSENNKVGYSFTVNGTYRFFNGACGGKINYFNLPKDKEILESLTVNGTVYNSVFIIDCVGISSDNSIYLNKDFQFDKIYFDLKQGVIGVFNANNQEIYWIQP
ncbi:MAG: hypothetical protein KBA33_01455 [Cloacibacterium sp.]|nr:hypothetical protein [Cloacibacterium sp.]